MYQSMMQGTSPSTCSSPARIFRVLVSQAVFTIASSAKRLKLFRGSKHFLPIGCLM